jgi:multisubunit Na+/H+ antiporter MnhB subunit
MTIGFILIASFFILITILYIHDKDKEMIGLFLFMLAIITIIGMVIGSDIQLETGTYSKKPIKPIIKVECTNGKCDTTYIYKTKE